MRKHKRLHYTVNPRKELPAYDMKDLIQQHQDEYIELATNSIYSGLPEGGWYVGSTENVQHIDLYRARNSCRQLGIRIVVRGAVNWKWVNE